MAVGDPLRWPRGTLLCVKVVTSPTSGGRSVGIDRSWTKPTEFVSQTQFCYSSQNIDFFGWKHNGTCSLETVYLSTCTPLRTERSSVNAVPLLVGRVSVAVLGRHRQHPASFPPTLMPIMVSSIVNAVLNSCFVRKRFPSFRKRRMAGTLVRVDAEDRSEHIS
jgi:hypothetical protein